jgi:spore germination cell wall hydrolase CwlJ-like protein
MKTSVKIMFCFQIILALIFIFIIKTAYASERDCLVEAIYFEARGESFIGQLAVANVILERVRHPKFPNTICKVVHSGRYYKGAPVKHKCAFSYWCDGKPERMRDKSAMKDAISVAKLALDGVLVEEVLGATYYHATYTHPKWAYEFQMIARIGKHLFYDDLNYSQFIHIGDDDAKLHLD